MYSKQEASQIKKKFWTSFGQYMRPLSGANGDTINWLNYKTGIKHIYFRLDAEKKDASIAIELTHPDIEIQQQHFEQLLSLKKILEGEMEEEWNWENQLTDEHGILFSRISTRLPNVNVFNSNDWPAIISFFKPRMLALDRFWDLVKDGFG